MVNSAHLACHLTDYINVKELIEGRCALIMTANDFLITFSAPLSAIDFLSAIHNIQTLSGYARERRGRL